jgi:glutamate N-acetyltransferase/amino-acid N-acetyltransferase
MLPLLRARSSGAAWAPAFSSIALRMASASVDAVQATAAAGGAARMSTSTFASEAEYIASLEPISGLPRGFRVGTSSFSFRPREIPERTANMNLTLIALDKPTSQFAGMFTSNSFPGAPVIVGRKRLASDALQAIVVNNKISNVCAPGGVEDSEAVCSAVAKHMGLAGAHSVVPCSTGIIG